MTPLERYQNDIAENGFQRDEAQHKAVAALDKLYHAIVAFQSAPAPELSKWQKLMGKKNANTSAAKRPVLLGRSRARQDLLNGCIL